MKKELILTRGARNVLMGALQSPGWCGTPKYIYLAGEMLTKVLPEWEEAPEKARQDAKEMRAWLEATAPLTFTGAQIKACVACLRWFMEMPEDKQRPRLNPSRWLYELMTALEMAPKDVEEE